MSRRRLTPAILIALIALLATLVTGPTATAATTADTADTTPPSAPLFGYAQAFYCLTLIIGGVISTDNVTPQSQLRFDVFDDGAFIGPLTDRGSGPWAVLALRHTGPNAITVQAIDAAGNRSAFSRTVTVTGHYTPGSGCTPGRI